ncbi:MAG: hypothetical protein PVI06_20750, partial [Desulfobacterales bacterium]
VLWLIDSNQKTGDDIDTDHYLNRLFEIEDVDDLVATLEKRSEDNFILFPNSRALYQKIADTLKKRSETIFRLEKELTDAAQ